MTTHIDKVRGVLESALELRANVAESLMSTYANQSSARSAELEAVAIEEGIQEALSAISAHEAEVKELVEAVREYRRAAHDETLAQDAHCDHSVGICWCGYKRALEDLDAAIAKVTP